MSAERAVGHRWQYCWDNGCYIRCSCGWLAFVPLHWLAERKGNRHCREATMNDLIAALAASADPRARTEEKPA